LGGKLGLTNFCKGMSGDSGWDWYRTSRMSWMGLFISAVGKEGEGGEILKRISLNDLSEDFRGSVHVGGTECPCPMKGKKPIFNTI